MDIESLSLEERVFHLDDECYIIYLGSDKDDYKPFLRIGNSKKLTSDIISNIYNIVITDSFTGNPALEPRNVNTVELKEIRYVGDIKTVDKLLHFLDHYKIDTKSITFKEVIETQKHNAMLYLYDNGNVALYYDNNLIFDLNIRAQHDLHYIQKTSWIKNQFLNNPLRYSANDFQEPGFFILKNNIFLYNQEQFIALNLPEDYFSTLVQSGIDPELISSVITDELSPDFVNLCKRKKFKKENLNILTGNSPIFQSAVKLFVTGKADSLKYKLETFGGSTKKSINGFGIKKTASGFTATQKGIPASVFIGEQHESKDKKQIIIDPVKGVFIPPSERKGNARKIVEGIPHTFVNSIKDERTIQDIYIKDFIACYEGLFTAAESTLVRSLLSIVEDIREGRNVQNTLSNIKKVIRKIHSDSKVPLHYFLYNVVEISSYIINSEKEDSTLTGKFSALKNIIKRALGPTRKTSKHYPFICDCFLLPEGTYLLYRPVKRTIRSEDFALFEATVQAVSEKQALNLSFHNKELNRITSFIKDFLIFRRGRTKAGVREAKAQTTAEAPTASETQKADFSVGKSLTAQWKRISIPRWIFIVGALIAIVAILLFVPPISLFQKSIDKMKEREGRIVVKETGEKTLPEEKVSGQLDEESPGVVQKEEEVSVAEEKTGVTEQIEGEQVALADQEEIEAFLSLGYIQITVLDVFKLTNKIAVSNGYHSLDSVEELGKDPDWIYPQNLFTLPDGNQYTVVKGDTIWYIARRFIKKYLDRDWERYQIILKEFETHEIGSEKKQQLLTELESMKNGSYSENFVKLLEKKIEELQ
jgi:LysM repeat protein